MIDRIKYNKSKHQFMLIDNHRHYQTKNSRKEEILSIDSWLMDSDNRLVVNFKDNNGRKYRNVPIDVKNMSTFFNGKGVGNWKSFVWVFPTKHGDLCIIAEDDRCYFNNELIRSDSVSICMVD